MVLITLRLVVPFSLLYFCLPIRCSEPNDPPLSPIQHISLPPSSSSSSLPPSPSLPPSLSSSPPSLDLRGYANSFCSRCATSLRRCCIRSLPLRAADYAFCRLTSWGLPLYIVLETLRQSGLDDWMVAKLDRFEEWSRRRGWNQAVVTFLVGEDGALRWGIRNGGGSAASWDVYLTDELTKLVAERPERLVEMCRRAGEWMAESKSKVIRQMSRVIGNGESEEGARNNGENEVVEKERQEIMKGSERNYLKD